MKPDKIKWITVAAFGQYPEEGKCLLLSYNSGDHVNFRAATSEGFYDPYHNHPLRNERKEEHEPEFFEKHSGNGIICVYAWAYKPNCML